MSVEIETDRSSSRSSAQAHATVRPESRVAERSSMLASALSSVRVLLIALWLGAAVFFSAAVAPNVFAVLRSFHLPNANEIAGTIVTRTLGIVNTGGFLIALLLLVTAFLFRRTTTRRALRAEVASLLAIALMTGLGQWVIAARMLMLRTAMGRPVDEVAQSDPLRVAFNSLHGYSVGALSVAMIAGIVTLLLIARRARPNS
ncbi:MAG TPA: DUF4149 domain-containing protein [Pyrinomonadaceae bacterium]|nr:DUF4149 domain-containing protein [Pyrinomonadaceae bacterium]